MNFIEFDRQNPKHREELCLLFADYFTELFADDPENAPSAESLPEIFNWFVKALDFEDSWILVCRHDGEMAGFVFAQIDRPEKDWCRRPGWAMIREFYVAPKFRKMGIGRALMKEIEEISAAHNPVGIYLTTDTDGGFAFWKSVGYVDTGEIEEVNGGNIYIKGEGMSVKTD
jgi:ribosomal protein S18 acetylase RimI-like enzyme